MRGNDDRDHEQPRSPLAVRSDVLLQTASEESLVHGEFMRARIGQLFIVDFLYIGVVFGLGEKGGEKS